MATFWLHARAPFAAFRWMQAGAFRATAPVIPPSAAYGLVMNLAGIETRAARDGGTEVTTLQRTDLPSLHLAVGTRAPAGVSTLYQQLHGYPVGASGKELKARTHGAKYWIAPTRRELLVDFDVVIGVSSADENLPDRVRRGLNGSLDDLRYGLPFAGDNNLLFDRIELVTAPPPAYWYIPLVPGDLPRRGSCRLTVGIDRRNSSRTSTVLMAPIDEAAVEPPESAWIRTPA